MNKKNWENLQSYLPLITDLNIDMAFLFLTETGYKKSIMDATIHVRNFLKRNNIHNYEIQGKGRNENGVLIPTIILSSSGNKQTKTSLYRPETKNGDPRLWVYDLKKYCEPESFIVLFANKNEKSLYLLNLSDKNNQKDLFTQIKENKEINSNLYNTLINLSYEENKVSRELVDKIRKINSKGFIPTVTNGDTGIGMTLEKELKIPPNTSKKPDYKGIELKTYRSKKNKTINRSNLFTKTPNWKNSKYKSSKELLDAFGYWSEDKNRIDLNCTIKYNIPNPQGLYLDIDENNEKLEVLHETKGKVVEWDFKTLYEALLKKHHETFWVKAETKIINNIEHFKYVHIIHTKNPQIELFNLLIESQVITLDFIMHIKSNGTARDHGYPFKISKNNLNKLFPEIDEYDLDN